jgi:hypothetical protein
MVMGLCEVDHGCPIGTFGYAAVSFAASFGRVARFAGTGTDADFG